MKKAAILIAILLGCLRIDAQAIDSLDQEVSPKGGSHELALVYYGIEFSKAQRERLKRVEIEFIYIIDETGVPTLREINGVSDPEILDSLRNKTAEIPPFNPRIRHGKPVPALYFMMLEFPSYKPAPFTSGWLQRAAAYNEAKLEDFEYLIESGQRLDLMVGGLAHQFIGSPSRYLAFGGGAKIDVGYAGKNRLIYGMNMSVYTNKLRQPYPISTTREQLNAPVTLLVGLVFGKWLNDFNVQGELNFAVQNVTPSFGNPDPGWVQLEGWSPGVVLNYPIKFGKSTPSYYYGSPAIMENNLNLHFGIRYVKLSLAEATGMMVEFGVGYRVATKGVKEYKLKADL